MSTKIAISTQNKKTISGHAGKCKNFIVYTVDTEGNYTAKPLKLGKGESLHDTFQNTTQTNPLFDTDIFLTQSIGQGAIEKLAAKGVRTYIIKEDDPETAINKLIAGTLQAYGSGGHHHHEHEHEHGHRHAGCNCGGGHQ